MNVMNEGISAQSPALRAPVSTPTPQHLVARLVYSPTQAARFVRWSMAIVAILLGVNTLRSLVGVLSTPRVYDKDFVQDYLIGAALLHDVDPYLPQRELAERFVPMAAEYAFATLIPSPTPHAPTLALLFAPFALLDYATAAAVWLAFEYLLLAATLYLLFRAAGVAINPLGLIAVTMFTTTLHPVVFELLMGQVMILLLFFLAAARLALLSSRPVVGGALLGLALLVKPVTWPLGLLLLVRKEWRSSIAMAVTVAFGYLAALVLIGPERLVTYFTRVLPLVNGLYRSSAWNSSTWALGWRIFDGTGSTAQPGIVAAPILDAPELAAPTAAILTLAMVGFAGYLAWRQRHLDPALGIAICVSIVVSPVSWDYYRVLAIVPAALVLQSLARRQLPPGETLVALVTLMLVIPSSQHWGLLAVVLAGLPLTRETLLAFPPIPALLSLMPVVAVSALAWLVASPKGTSP